MSDLISRDELKEMWCANCDNKHLCGGKAGCDDVKELYDMPTIEAEPTFEQIEEYCRKRCLVVVDGALFNEMKSRWSAEPIKHGHWVATAFHLAADIILYCSKCETEYSFRDLLRVGEVSDGHVILPNCCPHCGTIMDEETSHES